MHFKRRLIVIAVSLVLLTALAESTLTQSPNNIEALMGSSVRLTCVTTDPNYPPSWVHIRVGSTEPSDVYLTVRDGANGVVGRMTEEYYSRFKVDGNRETGDYSLSIENVELADAGRYVCTARGGLGQQTAAELGVIESSFPLCSSNATNEVIGENICNHEIDYIELNCTFRYRGNVLPEVTWVKGNQEVLITGQAKWTDESGVALSKFVVKADTDGLDGSSLTCVVHGSGVSRENKPNCTTPVITVLKIANVTESRELDRPEEVQCGPLPQLPHKGCKWVKRNLGGDSTETVVTEGSLLNLYRPEFDSGTYVCIVECSIRGQPCTVEALMINYQPAGPALHVFTEPPSNSLVIILTVTLGVGGFVATLILIIMLFRKHGFFSHGSSRLGSEKERVPMKKVAATEDEVIDVPDSMALIRKGGGREDRNRLLEEQARMRRNAALRQGMDNTGVSSSADDGLDVAEGIASATTNSKDE